MSKKKDMQEVIDELSYELDSWKESYEVCFNELEEVKYKLYVVRKKLKKLRKVIGKWK